MSYWKTGAIGKRNSSAGEQIKASAGMVRRTFGVAVPARDCGQLEVQPIAEVLLDGVAIEVLAARPQVSAGRGVAFERRPQRQRVPRFHSARGSMPRRVKAATRPPSPWRRSARARQPRQYEARVSLIAVHLGRQCEPDRGGLAFGKRKTDTPLDPRQGLIRIDPGPRQRAICQPHQPLGQRYQFFCRQAAIASITRLMASVAKRAE